MSEPSQTSSLPSASASPTDTDSDSFFDFSAPVSWIFIPILLLALVAATLACLTVRRRRRRRTNPAWPGFQPNDPERAGAGARTRGPYPRVGARAGWAPRSSEGLNELGEAPPAYEPKAKPGQAVPAPRDGSIELQQLEHRPDGASSPSAPPPPPATAEATPNLPPDYSAVREGAGAASSPPPPLITTPPPAVSRH